MDKFLSEILNHKCDKAFYRKYIIETLKNVVDLNDIVTDELIESNEDVKMSALSLVIQIQSEQDRLMKELYLLDNGKEE